MVVWKANLRSYYNFEANDDGSDYITTRDTTGDNEELPRPHWAINVIFRNRSWLAQVQKYIDFQILKNFNSFEHAKHFSIQISGNTEYCIKWNIFLFLCLKMWWEKSYTCLWLHKHNEILQLNFVFSVSFTVILYRKC